MDKFELRVKKDDKFIEPNPTWTGENGEEACKRYAAEYPSHVVYAWRNYPRHGLFVGSDHVKIIE